MCIAKTRIPPCEATFMHISQNGSVRGGHSTVRLHSIVHSFGPAHLSAGGRGPCAHEFQLHQVTAGWCSLGPLQNNRAPYIWILRELQIIAVAEKENSVLRPAALKSTPASRGQCAVLSHNACVLIIATTRCNKALKLN